MLVVVRASKQRLAPGRAKMFGVVAFLAAVSLPVALWHDSISALAAGYSPSPGYFVAAWTPFCLIGLGLLLMLPVVYSIGLSSYAPTYPRRRNAYAGWGITLYLLGLGLATQVAWIAHGLTTP
jgi:MFS family permease